MRTEDDLLNISGIQHFVFCRRQWALIHIEQQWSENVLTVSGELMHQNAHDGTSTEKRGDVLISRGMPVKSRELGLTGVCDVVEFHKSSDGALLHGGRGLKCKFRVKVKARVLSPSTRRAWIEIHSCILPSCF